MVAQGKPEEKPQEKPRPVRVVVWDERQPVQKRAYQNFLGNQIAEHLKARGGFTVNSVALDDPQQGLSKDVLDGCDVLIWWGHVRQNQIKPQTGKRIVAGIKAGRLSLITLHSAHWSTPFIQAMYERAREDALAKLSPQQHTAAKLKEIYPRPFRAPKRGDPLTPAVEHRRTDDGRVEITLKHANCCFPVYRADGKPSEVRTLLPRHPIARGVPATFSIPQTEAYDEPFHVPPPDAVIFEERWKAGERFRSGSLWKLGKGWVFYFRPGHETYPIFKQPIPLKILENAARWLGSKPTSAIPAAATQKAKA
ncbi:MAG: trehalose utilization protein [Phycisphaerae bacterium SM23_33]|nr:MAG: trehalose utilization protein [Phycisphaerae bacterium SM23_33]